MSITQGGGNGTPHTSDPKDINGLNTKLDKLENLKGKIPEKIDELIKEFYRTQELLKNNKPNLNQNKKPNLNQKKPNLNQNKKPNLNQKKGNNGGIKKQQAPKPKKRIKESVEPQKPKTDYGLDDYVSQVGDIFIQSILLCASETGKGVESRVESSFDLIMGQYLWKGVDGNVKVKAFGIDLELGVDLKEIIEGSSNDPREKQLKEFIVYQKLGKAFYDNIDHIMSSEEFKNKYSGLKEYFADPKRQKAWLQILKPVGVNFAEFAKNPHKYVGSNKGQDIYLTAKLGFTGGKKLLKVLEQLKNNDKVAKLKSLLGCEKNE